ncbi:hypothetical protein QCE62_00540 [Caballeronia sp. LZ033]|uniref:hypothetical protein n=1 Tax=Caballeronia sp. LZ033 TaxID=3038566 RepID=UPI00285C46F3|nr:hypothetical protein [Caballeronia sp. LZ033]MDR5812074.1 hypothetical protein [Caballeronia sp. LZ033]
MTFRESPPDRLYEEAMRNRREMVSDGVLISGQELCARLRISEKRLNKLIDGGSLFSIPVDDGVYFPALLADPRLNRQRLRKVCRLLVPAPADARLDYLSSRRGSLGGHRPLDLLNDDSEYSRLLSNAGAWVEQWSRTFVTLYEGEHEVEPPNTQPLYTAIEEIDPRRAILDRASATLRTHGYQFPLGPYPEVRRFTVFVSRQDTNDVEARPEACVQIVVDGELVRIRVIYKEAATQLSQTLPVGKGKNILEVAKRVIEHFRRH